MTKKSKKIRYSPTRKKTGKHGTASKGSRELHNILQQAFMHHQAGRLQQAEPLYRQILDREPHNKEALNYLGLLAHQAGKSGIGIKLINRAISTRPDYAEAHYNLGNILQALDRREEAAECFRRVLSLKPDYAEAYTNLGVILLGLNKLEDAITNFRQALTLQPNDYLAGNNLGIALTGLERQEEAAECFRQALALQPEYVEANYNLGNTLRDLGRLEEAAVCFRRALDLQPDFAEACYNLGIVLQTQGKLEEAISAFRRALALQPEYSDAHSNLLFCMNYLPGITQKEIYEESLEWHHHLAMTLPERPSDFTNSKTAGRRLRIGYVSGDFRNHSVAYFIEPVLRSHDRDKVEIYCYSNVRKPDDRTRRLRSESDHWRPISSMPDSEIAKLIRKDGIDILVDLGGHTGEKKLPVFAHRPAPIQITWLGYPNTTGLASMDYRITDVIADPEGVADILHSEELLRLEHGFLCYQPEASAPEVAPLPCMEHGYVTFGSFNNLAKINTEVIKTWAEILRDIPQSRLLLKSKSLADPATRERYTGMFAENGIPEDRLELHGWLASPHDHLKLYSKIDIGLDPFPYNGTTTTCEALWMGIPVVTLLGDRHASRVGASIMHHAGLAELTASSRDEYIALALELAHDRLLLRTFRNDLRRRLQASLLMNQELFAKTLEKAYTGIWEKWCAGN